MTGKGFLFTLILLLAPAAGARAQDIDTLIEGLEADGVPSAGTVAKALLGEESGEIRRWTHALAGLASREQAETSYKLTLQALAEILEREAPGPEPSAASLAGLELASLVGTDDDLEVTLRLGRPHEGLESSSRRFLRRQLEKTLTDVISRHPDAIYDAAELAKTTNWIEALVLAGAISNVKDQESIRCITSLLGYHMELDQHLLGLLNGLATGLEPATSASTLNTVRRYLDSSLAGERREASLVLGRMDDYESVPSLVARLEDTDSGVSAAAHWALIQITRMTMAPDPPRWNSWFEEESAWWSESGVELTRILRSSDEPSTLVPAIARCSTRRLFRRQLGPELVPLLSHPEPSVVRMTCSALVSLRFGASVPVIVDLLDEADPDVRKTAHQSLLEMTGLVLPADREAWLATLEPVRARPR